MKQWLVLLLITVSILTFLVACGSSKQSGQETSTTPNTIRFNGNVFSISSILIKKGSHLKFVNNFHAGNTSHILTFGRDGQNEAAQGAPNFGGASGIRVDVGQTWTSPPWNTAGTYYITCTVHPWMNLTVIVAN